jgi:glycosyltransferase involved in cell wall biosynthesis
MKIVCLLSVRNGEWLLPGFFRHLRQYVDGFIVVDDASTDASRDIILKESKLLASHYWATPALEHSRESSNRFKLVSLAAELGAHWALSFDVDERAETNLLKNLRNYCRRAARSGLTRITGNYRELWDSPRQYRVDGLWGAKRRIIAFQIPKTITPRPDGTLHATINPPGMDSLPALDSCCNLYHLGMIDPGARARRRQKFERLDPQHRWQAIGYAYLEDHSGLVLEDIPRGREYFDPDVETDLQRNAGFIRQPGEPDLMLPDKSGVPVRMSARAARAVQLTVILPFFKKFAEFERVLKFNAPHFLKPHLEVLLCLDEDSESSRVCRLLERFARIKWKVIVCHQPHPWRPPSKAINVGIRHAAGDYVMIVSPESLFIGDVPAQMLSHAALFPAGAICGRVNFCRFAELADGNGTYEAMLRYQHLQTNKPLHYGSICLSRAKAFEVGGYDECLTRWGGDDDNFRARLQLAGLKIVKTNDVNILHLGFESRNSTRPQKTARELDYLFSPKQPVCPRCFPRWGRAFTHIVRDWR